MKWNPLYPEISYKTRAYVNLIILTLTTVYFKTLSQPMIPYSMHITVLLQYYSAESYLLCLWWFIHIKRGALVLQLYPRTTKLLGGVLVSIRPSVRPSVHPSVRPASCVRSVASRVLVGSISYLYILSSNTRSCVNANILFIENDRVESNDYCVRVDSRFAPSQWEMALVCNDVSHWLGANLDSAL